MAATGIVAELDPEVRIGLFAFGALERRLTELVGRPVGAAAAEARLSSAWRPSTAWGFNRDSEVGRQCREASAALLDAFLSRAKPDG